MAELQQDGDTLLQSMLRLSLILPRRLPRHLEAARQCIVLHALEYARQE